MFSVNEQGSESRCTRFLVRASTSKTIVFLLENLTANGCNFGSTLSSFVNCEECPEGSGMSGGFAVNIPKENIQTALRDKSASKFGGGKTSSLIPTKPTIVVCHNHVTDYTDFETIVAHELIHAIDQCRVKNVDFGNINHHACTEVRASNLSGECKYFTEVGRGVFQSRNGQQECVKRRAGLSVAANPNLKGDPKEAVSKVFDRCYRDTYPFMRHPNE